MRRLDDAAYFACDSAYYYTYRTFRGLCVRLRVCVLDISVSRAKTAEPIEMSFWWQTHVGLLNRVLDEYAH